MRARSRVALLATLVFGVLPVAGASAATIDVTTHADEFGSGGTGKCALREAIQAANNDQKFGGCSKGHNNDTIVLGKGIYKLTIEVDDSVEDANVEGDLDVLASMTLVGQGAKKTAIDGNSERLDERILNQKAGDLSIKDVTLRNGQSIDDDDDRGGAVWNEGAGRLAISGARIVNNYAYYSGGGVAATDGGTLDIRKSLIADNATDDYGAAVTTYIGGGRVKISRTKIVGNNAEDGAAIIVGEGKLTLDHSTIANNTGVDYGGGIDLYGKGATIRNSTISGNRATGADYGGGIYDENNHGPVLIENSTISDNHTGAGGGGIYAESDVWTIRNSTIARNQALDDASSSGYGGGIYNGGATMKLESVTLSGNAAYDSAGLYESGGSTTIRNSILARNRDYGEDHWIEDCHVSSGTVTSLGHNLIGDGSCNPVGSDIAGDTTNQVFPGLEPLASNGGPTETQALIAGSPAINKGAKCPKTDQRGHKRKGKCDIGAFER